MKCQKILTLVSVEIGQKYLQLLVRVSYLILGKIIFN